VNRRIGALGAIAILAVLALGISNASAASLRVIAGKLGTFNVADRCVTGPLPVTVAGTPTAGSYPQVHIGTVLAACDGKAIKLTVFGTGGSVLGTSQALATASTDTTTVTMMATYPGALVLGAALTIGGYGVTTTWTGPPPPPGSIIIAGANTAVVLGAWFWDGARRCVSATVSGTSGWKLWQLDVNTASAPFNGASLTFTGPDASKVTTSGPLGGPLSVIGALGYEYLQQKSAPLVFNICG
jgi:hypothetical protein